MNEEFQYRRRDLHELLYSLNNNVCEFGSVPTSVSLNCGKLALVHDANGMYVWLHLCGIRME